MNTLIQIAKKNHFSTALPKPESQVFKSNSIFEPLNSKHETAEPEHVRVRFNTNM